jgi:hypothetical protein
LIRQGNITRVVDIQLARAAPGLAEAWRHGLHGPDEITQTELNQFLAVCLAVFLHLEDAFYQHEEGLLNDDAFATVLAGMRTFAGFPAVRVAWKAVRSTYAGRFGDFVDGIVARARLEPATYNPSVDEFRAAYAAETTGAHSAGGSPAA